eukprot:Skav206511  [mRNA]  locus=scaffold2251:139939:140586:- [translate_table: standard]
MANRLETLEVTPVLPPMSVAPKTSYFTVAVPTKKFSTLGLQLELTDTRAPTILEIQEGAIREFNKAYRASGIRPFDVLIALDGIQNWEAMQKKMSEKLPEKMFLTLKRPRWTRIVLEKTGNMGLTLNYTDKSVGVLVKHLDCKGLVAKWNAQNMSDALEVMDRIIEVDGEAYHGTELATLLEDRKTWHLTVLKYAYGEMPVQDRVMEGLSRRSFF